MGLLLGHPCACKSWTVPEQGYIAENGAPGCHIASEIAYDAQNIDKTVAQGAPLHRRRRGWPPLIMTARLSRHARCDSQVLLHRLATQPR